MSRIREPDVNLPSEASGQGSVSPDPISGLSIEQYGFNTISGQTNAIFMLQKMLSTGNIPNALLFTGNPDTGRKKAALLFAMAINCQNQREQIQKYKKTPNSISIQYRNEPCSECISCKKIIQGTHPDIIRISPENNKIKISKIRKINNTLTMKPNEARMRMVLIENADRMNKEAENALLKILEEPPEKTFFILISDRPENILPTIISRCQNIKFRDIPCKNVESELTKKYGISSVFASIAAQYSNGSISKALMFSNTKKKTAHTGNDSKTGGKIKAPEQSLDWIKRRQWLIPEISNIIMAKQDNKKADAGIVIAIAEKIGRQPDYIEDTIFILKTWLRDIAVYRYCPDKIINHDFSSLLSDITDTIDIEKIISWFKELNKTENRIKSNTSIKLSLECFLLKMLFC